MTEFLAAYGPTFGNNGGGSGLSQHGGAGGGAKLLEGQQSRRHPQPVSGINSEMAIRARKNRLAYIVAPSVLGSSLSRVFAVFAPRAARV
ncbi:MAG: hypothetical protein L0241_25500 [Planctomycetia bacterium]|nr:hypothetical protein [Planctomycetia bacterium]